MGVPDELLMTYLDYLVFKLLILMSLLPASLMCPALIITHVHPTLRRRHDLLWTIESNV